MNTDAERNESELVRRFLRHPLYFSSVYHKGYQLLICFLGTEAGFKGLRGQQYTHLELTRRPPSQISRDPGKHSLPYLASTGV